jgi:TatD DNase family protein
MNDQIELIDGHAHLNELTDIFGDFARARDAGVTAVLGVGMDLSSNRRILELAEEYPGFVVPAIGFHPWEIQRDTIDDTLSFLEDNIHRCIALGEVGLDYKARVKKDLQRDVFREIISLAVKYDKILILHCRYSHQRVFSMITDGGVRRAVFHWYTGSLELLDEIIGAGYHISATPALQYSPPHQAAVAAAPLERILLETDCPVEYQGKESRPIDVIITARETARIRGLSLAEVAGATTENTKRLYNLES